MTDHSNVALHLRFISARAKQEAAAAPTVLDRMFCEQKATEFKAAAEDLERLTRQTTPGTTAPARSARSALMDRNREPSTALERMLADPADRDNEIDKAIDDKTNPWGETGGDIVLMNPDCRAGKHDVCDGRGWNETRNHGEDCPCRCHRGRAGGRW